MRGSRDGRLKTRQGVLVLILAAFVVTALLAVLAVKLADTQAGSKRDVETRVHERAVLAAALIDSLFNTVNEQRPQYEALYGGRTVSVRTLDAHRAGNLYVAVLDARGAVIATSQGFDGRTRAELVRSAALSLVRAGHPYGLGNVLPYARTGVINLAVRLPTRYGLRFLLTGLAPRTLSGFIGGELAKIPGVHGAHNYLLDGNDRVIASTNPAFPAGYVFSSRGQVSALRHASGTQNGLYFDQVSLANSTLRIVLAAPDGPLFASVTGLRKWLPWVIFLALGLTAAAALALGRRALLAADLVRIANIRLARANEELASTNTTLERRASELARSNAELEQFASIASHDLQEPLRKVRTFTERLSEIEADRLSPQGQDYLERTNRAAERMQRLIGDLLKFSRVATHGRSFEAVDLGSVATEVLEDLEGQIERAGATVDVGPLPIVLADPVQMRQLLQNLISNAIKFRRSDAAPTVVVGGELEAGHARITVSDDGIGFDPRYADRIFRVFERLNGRGEYDGTGIGLALCRKIADRHGGTVFAQSREGHGSTFTVILPDERIAGLSEDPEVAIAGRAATHAVA